MKKTITFCLLILIYFITCSEVSELTTSNFTEGIAKGWHFVQFYAPWCGHCKKLAPVWEQLAKENVLPVTYHKINCDVEEQCKKEPINGYPTLLLYYDGKFVAEYLDDDNRDVFHISEFAKKYISVKKLTASDFEQSIKDGNHWLIRFYTSQSPVAEAVAEIYREVASQNKNEKVKLGEVDCFTETELCEKQQIKKHPTVKFYKDGNVIEFTGRKNVDGILKFIEEQTTDQPKKENKLPKSRADEFVKTEL